MPKKCSMAIIAALLFFPLVLASSESNSNHNYSILLAYNSEADLVKSDIWETADIEIPTAELITTQPNVISNAELQAEMKAANESVKENISANNFAMCSPVSGKESIPSQIKSLPESGMVCLTFDDGYSRASIIKILDCLRESNVECTFFVIGACLKLYPDLWRRAVEDGHEIAYHTMNHTNLNNKSSESIKRDIQRWNETAFKVLGEDYRIPMLARAPGGRANTRVRKLFSDLGYSLIYWSCDTFTGVYRSNHKNVGERSSLYILKTVCAGSITLQHFNKYDAPSVPLYINELKNRFELGKLSDAMHFYESDYVYCINEKD